MCVTQVVKCFHCGKWFKKTFIRDFENCPHCGKGIDDLSGHDRELVMTVLAPFFRTDLPDE